MILVGPELLVGDAKPPLAQLKMNVKIGIPRNVILLVVTVTETGEHPKVYEIYGTTYVDFFGGSSGRICEENHRVLCCPQSSSQWIYFLIPN